MEIPEDLLYGEIEEEIIENKRKIRDAERYKIRELVFDQKTLETIFELQKKGYIGELKRIISTGKEANVYLANWPDFEYIGVEDYRAVKIYKIETSKFKSFEDYLLWDPRFKFLETNNKRKLIYAWCKKEFSNLLEAYSVGVRVPKPYKFMNNVIVMEFIGKEGIPSPRLKDYVPENPKEFLDKVYEYLLTLKNEAKLVHADISEYNILVLDEEPVIIDMAQAVKEGHPLFEEFWRRDIYNLNKIAKKLGVKNEYK
jgi:RIO kinase 1